MTELVHELNTDKKKYIWFQVCRHVKNGNTLLPSFHRAMEFWAVIKGKYYAWVDGKEYSLTHGDVLFIDSYKTHSFTLGTDTDSDEESAVAEKAVIVFDADYLIDIIGTEKIFPTLIKNEDFFREFTRIAIEAGPSWWYYSEPQRMGMLYRILGLAVQKLELTSPGNRRGDPFAKAVVEYIMNHYSEDISVNTLADMLGYTEGYFSELFNKTMQMSFREYLNRLRIDVADSIKRVDGNISLREISEMVGYKSWSTFYRAYSKYSELK